MSPASTNAIADFMRRGGRVVKVQATISVTVPELLDYLAGYDIRPKYSPRDSRAYLYNGKRFNVSKLIELANRRVERLAPFAARVHIHVGGSQP